jgi:ABC-type multidrug transport system fused ATPase/permease subunit
MKIVASIYLAGIKAIGTRSRKFLALYNFYLISLAAIDGLGLLLLARLLTDAKVDSDFSFQSTVVLIVFLFILKSVLAMTGMHLGLKEFAKIEMELGKRNFSNLLGESWLGQRNSISSDYFNSVDRGPKELAIGIFLSISTIIAELASITVIVIVIFVAQPLTSLVILVYFGAATVFQHKLLARAAADAGLVAIKRLNTTYQILQDVSELSKLLKVQPSLTLESHLNGEREKLAKARNATWFYSALPRYVLEGILGIGFVLVAFVTYLANGSAAVYTAVGFFAVAGFRLLPSINRIQGMLFGIMSVTGLARLGAGSLLPSQRVLPHNSAIPVSANTLAEFDNVSFEFPDSDTETLKQLTFSMIKGKQYAIVGKSGAGKSTLLDLLLGVLEPTEGNVLIDRSTTRIGFVPQDTFLFYGTIAQNVALEWDDSVVDFKKVADCLTQVGLSEFYAEEKRAVPDQDNVLNMSGGQKQRIGLARALYREPRLLILDEATSALDGETEVDVMNQIGFLGGGITVVIVAHRLSTLRNVDEIIYLEDGLLKNMCSWSELYEINSSFRKQVDLGRV